MELTPLPLPALLFACEEAEIGMAFTLLDLKKTCTPEERLILVDAFTHRFLEATGKPETIKLHLPDDPSLN